MSTNLTDEIRNLENESERRIADAKAQAASLVSKASEEALARVKEAKQEQFRAFKARLTQVETEAAKKAADEVAQGDKEAKEFVEAHQTAVQKMAQWVADEVVSRYGRS